MKSSSGPKSLIIVVVLAAVVVGYVVLFFLPNYRHITKLDEDLQTKQTFVQTSEQTAPLLHDMEAQLATTIAYNKTWTKHAPRQGEISIILGKINALARSANVVIDSFDPEPAESLDRLRIMPLALECKGRLHEMFAFLSELERMPQTIWMKSATIQQSGKRAGRKYREYVQCELDMEIFMDNLGNSN